MRKWFFFLLTACLYFSSCATLPVLAPQPPSPEDLLEQVGARLQALQGLKGLAQVKISSPERTFSAQEVLFVQRPGFLRLESLGLLGTPQLYLATDGHELNLYNPGENRYYRGPATANYLSSALPVALGPKEAVALLLGGLPFIDYEISSVRGERKEGLWILELLSTSREERQIFWVHPQSFHILRAEFHHRRSSRLLTFADYRPIQGLLFPMRIQLTSLEPKAQISVEYQEVELNPDWNRKDFLLPIPRGATVVLWK